MSDSIIEIDSIDDLPIALDLIAENKSYMGAITMRLPDAKQFKADLHTIRGDFTRTITHAYCGISHQSSRGTDRWISAALTAQEGYCSEQGITKGTLIHATSNRAVFMAAVERFFNSQDFTEHRADPLTHTVVPDTRYSEDL